MKEKFQNSFLPAMMRFFNSDPLVAVKDGMIATMALTIVGSMFLLLARFPYLPIQEWFAVNDITPTLLQVAKGTFDMLGIVSAIAIAYYYAKQKGVEALSAGILSFVSYVLLMPHQLATSFTAPLKDTLVNSGEALKPVLEAIPAGILDAATQLQLKVGTTVTGVMPTSYLGSKGMVAAIILGLAVGVIYSAFIKRGITIKMPAGVPEGVANSFAAVIPGAVIITLSAVLFGVLRMNNTTFIDIIYSMIQTPLQGLTSSFWGALGMAFFISFLWWFGVHGASIIGGILGGVLTANMLANQAILDAGQVLTAANGHIVTFTFRTLLVIMTGSGITIGVVLYMLFFAKSEQFKSLGKLSIGSAIFNINEPILFGTPIVLNPLLFIPFVGVPVVVTAVAYLAFQTGLVPLLGAINPPWTTPGIISGLIASGWQMALLQAVIIVISFVGYFPFIRKQDQINYEAELAAKKEG